VKGLLPHFEQSSVLPGGAGAGSFGSSGRNIYEPELEAENKTVI
jgi:hypothetical protein